jgi:Ca2+-binding RTX toxin-like protein
VEPDSVFVSWDILSGGGFFPTFNMASYAGAPAAVHASLARPVLNTGEAAGDRYVGISGLIGSAFADTLEGAAATSSRLQGADGADLLLGGRVNDIMEGQAGDDSLLGREGHDRLDGGDGRDSLRGAAGHDVLLGGAGDDFLHGGEAWDSIAGGDGNDTILCDADFQDVVAGGAGDDVVWGSAGHDVIGVVGYDVLNGSLPFDRYVFHIDAEWYQWAELGTGRDTLLGAAGDDLMFSGDDDDRLDGGDGYDILFAGSGHDRVFGGAGKDIIQGDAGDDTLSGGTGNDTLGGGTGADQLDGEAGNDLLRGLGAGSRLSGGAGADTLEAPDGGGQLLGGAGNDVFAFTRLDPAGSATPVVIRDFTPGMDRIDLSAIDADPKTGPYFQQEEFYDDAFAFIGTAGFTGGEGEAELRLERDRAGRFWRIELDDADADALADLVIIVRGSAALQERDFIL